MENHYWLDKWQNNDIAFHENNINTHLKIYLEKLNLNPGDTILVPLCGKTKDMLWLAECGLQVIGIELSPIACHDFFAELNITPQITKLSHFTKYQYNNIQILCGDIFTLSNSDLPIIHAIFDCKSLIALPPNLRKKYVDHILGCTGDNIKILLLVLDTNCHTNTPPYSVNNIEVELLYGSHFKIELLKALPFTTIPEHLLKKGYSEITENVYLLEAKPLHEV